MCGIIGYAGDRNSVNILISSLKRLEYRGYDSAGIAMLSNDRADIATAKNKGKIANLEAVLDTEIPDVHTCAFTVGIGHTRWATHGEPSKINSHPHLSKNREFAVVHNGIIENFNTLKSKLQNKGYIFTSDTDSEVVAHLIQEHYTGDFKEAVTLTMADLEGTYGILALSLHDPDTIIATRRGSPVILGIGDNETIIASDVSAIINHTRRVIFLDDWDIAVVTKDDIDISSLKNIPVNREPTEIDWNINEIEKGDHEHFMHKEILEQPEVLANAIRGRLLEDEGVSKLNGLKITPREISHISRILLAACGTSYHAAMLGKYLFEDFAGIPTDARQAAEFKDRNALIERDTLMLAVSQSGETADTLQAIREGIRKGANVMGICNVVGSTIARETDRGVYLHAGPEISVASTKAFTSQTTVLMLIALLFARTRKISINEGNVIIKEIMRLPDIAREVLKQEENIKKIAAKCAHFKDFFFIGRGYMYPAALEGALKLKEISYIHAEGYHAAELKHGPIALLDENTPVIVAAPSSTTQNKAISNIRECKARNAPVIVIGTEGDESIFNECDGFIAIPPCPEYLAPIPVVIAEQLFAYHVARILGCDIDQPRNLAKSVTVE